MTRRPILQSLREAIVTTSAAVVTMLCALAIDPEPGPAVMAVVLSLTLARSHLDLDARGRWEAAVALPVVSVAALGVGALLLHLPWIGALAFVVGVSLSIWLRRFGPLVRRAGSLIALPFVVILTTPSIPTTRLSPLMAVCMPVLVAEFALLWVSLAHALARRWQWLAPARVVSHATNPEPPRESTMRPIASTRMAIQMGIALAIAFIVGFVFFAERWAWVVLTAYIVGSGNQGRLDVAYKSVLRVAGAAAGTVFALTFAFQAGSHDTARVVLMLAAVFLGVWLRPMGYAWWALFVTLALSLLQGFDGASAQSMLGLRLEEIVVGAIIAVAAAWFVWPVRSADVMRRRVADVLAALADALDPATPAREADELDDAIERVDKVAPAFRASRWLTRGHRATQPADWADTVVALRASARTLIARAEAPVAVRKAVGAARKAMREPAEIGSALENLRRSLLRAESTEASADSHHHGQPTMSPNPGITIVAYEDAFADEFARLNREWLEAFGLFEEADAKQIDAPRKSIIDPGGEIFVAQEEGRVVGTCALVAGLPGVFEIAKFAVAPAARGRGLGRRLLEHAIERARARGAKLIVLMSSSKLTTAFQLYQSLGFIAKPVPEDQPYETADVYMELALG